MKDIKVNLSFENLKTGLVDVEGNEIKIGDVVILNNNENDLAKVCFGEFGVRNIETEEIVDYVIGFYLKTIETDVMSTLAPFCYDMQINKTMVKDTNMKVIKEECPCMKEPSYNCGMKCSRCGREL